MAKGKGVGQLVGQKDGARLKGQWGGVGTFVKGGRALVKGGKGLGQGRAEILISPRNIFLGVFYDNLC